MRPAPPLRPNLLNSNSNSGGGSSGGRSDGGVASLNSLSTYCSGRKNQPTFEEDALVLRVFEAYCAAYQNTARNTIHSGKFITIISYSPIFPHTKLHGHKKHNNSGYNFTCWY